MSRIGNRIINIPDNIEVTINKNVVEVKGPKGTLNLEIQSSDIQVKKDEKVLKVSRSNEEKNTKAKHGLYNVLISNMITGVKTGYQKKLELVGVGYRATKKGNGLTLSLGYSHPIEVAAIEGISYDLDGETKIVVNGIDKQLVGQVAANIRSFRKPEPYKGKGVKYEGEYIKRKAGKAGK